DGLDQARLFRVGLDLAPEPADHHVDAAVERDIAPAGHGVQQKVAAQRPAGAAHEFAQKGELAARQSDRLAGGALKHSGVEIENEPGDANRPASLPPRALASPTRRVRRSVHHSGPLSGLPQAFRRSTSDDYNNYPPETSRSNAVYIGLANSFSGATRRRLGKR